jgi:tetratricopeptide (TPR) repeat protein
LADDLRNYLELRPVSARPPSKIGRVARLIRRRPWVAAFLFTLLCGAVLGGFLAKHAWADYKAEKLKAFAARVDEGDAALFRCLTGQRPTWLPAIIEQYRQQGITAYSAALAFDANAIRPLVQRARLHASKKETLDLALADLDNAQMIQPNYASIRKFRGLVLDGLGRKEEGRVAREEAKNLYPTSAEDLYWLGVIAYSEELDFFASYTYFSQGLLIAPNDYWSRLERAYFGRIASDGEFTSKRVIPELEIAKTIRPDLPFASELLEKFYSSDRMDGPNGARQKKELTEQIERFGLDILRAYAMSELLQKEHKFEEAEAILRKVLDQDAGGRTAEQIGNLEYRIGHYEQARDWYSRAISEGATYSVAYSHLADALTAMRDWKNAERAYLDGIGEHPLRPFLYGRLGYWYEQRGRFGDAEKIYRKALPWYTFLLQQGKDDELRILEDRLRQICPKTKTEAKTLLLPRATAEFGAGKYAAAVKSLESCLKDKIWNEYATEAMITGSLARSLQSLGNRTDAIKWYRRAVRISDVDPALLLEFLCLVVEEEGAKGLSPELTAYDPARLRFDVRRNATLNCFAAWEALAVGNDKSALEKLVQADTYLIVASQNHLLVGEECLVCFVILQIVSERLADKRSVGLSEFLRRFPPDRVSALTKVFSLPKAK